MRGEFIVKPDHLVVATFLCTVGNALVSILFFHWTISLYLSSQKMVDSVGWDLQDMDRVFNR